MNVNYLFICIADQPLLVSLVSNMKRSLPECKIDALSTTPVTRPVEVYDRLYTLPVFYWFKKIFKRGYYPVYHLSVILWAMFRRPTYDVIFLHYVALMHLRLMRHYRRWSKSVVAVFWGSDLLRIPTYSYPWMKELIQECDKVNCGTEPVLEKVREIAGGDFAKYRVHRCRFGLEFLDTIRSMREGAGSRMKYADILEISGFGGGLRVVTVGSNGSPGQQHEKIISSLMECRYENVIFLFPVTYGATDSYIGRLREKVKGIDHPCLFFTRFMAPEQLAALRLITDIFVQLQVTDALSGAMMEHMYAGSVVVTGSWLEYDILKDNGVRFETVDRVEEIGNKIYICLGDLEKLREANAGNSEAIWKISAWENCIDDWLAL